MKKLSRRKKIFADNYLASADVEKSAEAAGYKSRGYGSRLLRDKDVLEYLSSYSTNDKIATPDEVLEFLTAVMRGEAAEIKVTTQKGESVIKEEPPSLAQRQKAAEMLAKRYRLFTEVPEEDIEDKEFSVNISVV